MNQLAELSELLALLYSAPLDPNQWHRFINRVCEATGSRCGALLSADRTMSRIDFGGGAGYDPGLLQVYNTHFCTLDPYHTPAMSHPRVGVEEEVSIRDGRLKVTSAPQMQLEGLIAQAARVSGAGPGPPGGAMLLPRPKRQALQLRVLPLRTEDGPTPSWASVLVLITDPEWTTAHPVELLRLLYGFTPSEATIANHLCAGLSPEYIAELRQVSLGTVRMQIKQLMRKAGVRRQTELIRLMLMLPGTVAAC